MNKLKIFWSENAKGDLKDIYFQLKEKYSKETALKIRTEVLQEINKIVFPEQFQTDEYRLDCRRIIIRNYKVLYQNTEDSIYVVRVFSSFQNPEKSLR